MPANPNAGTRMYYIRQSDGLAYCFSPVPFIAETNESVRSNVADRDTRLCTITRLTFAGTLLPDLPALSGVNPDASCLELLDRKSDQLKAALDEDYGNLLIVDASGYPVISVFPRVVSRDFDNSQMVVKRDYNVVFEYENEFEDAAKIKSFDNSWDFAQQPDDVVNVSHQISAQGIVDYPAGTGALENARHFVLGRSNTLDRAQYRFLKQPFVGSIIDLDSYTEYNHIRQETSNITAGQYSLNESWLMASGNYKDDRTVQTNSSLNELGDLVQQVSINGTVQGYGETTFARFNNAVVAFTTVIAPEINFSSVTGIVNKQRSDNRYAGTVNYSITFDTQDQSPFQDRSVQRSLTRNEDGTVTQSVTSSATIRPGSASGIQDAIDYAYANNYPISNFIEPYFSASLSGNVESVAIQRDEIRKSFSVTRGFREQGAPLWREEYQVSRETNAENAITTVTVNGTVAGMAMESGTASTVRFNAASGAYYNVVIHQIRDRALSIAPTGTCVGTLPIRTTLGYNIPNGIITYSQSFDNRHTSDNPLVTDEKISVSYKLAADIIASIQVPGKPTGPILQDQETQTGLEKNIKIQYTMQSGNIPCTMLTSAQFQLLESAALTESNILINNTAVQNSRGEKPIAQAVFKTADQYTFDRQTMVFSRDSTWLYTFS
jgi:hypothetical protein